MPVCSTRPTIQLAPAPPFWLAIGLLIGQALAPIAPGSAFAATAGVVSLICFLASLRGRCRFPVAALGAALGAAAVGQLQVDRLLHPHFPANHIQRFADSAVKVRGRIAQRPSRRPVQTRFLIDVTAVRHGGAWRTATGRVLVTVQAVEKHWQRGDLVQARLSLRRPRNFRNPGEFDYEAHLARRHIYVTGFSPSDRSWQHQATPRDTIGGQIESWRDEVARTIHRTLEEPAGQIVAALLLGEAGALKPEIRERYARAGVSHILAISGLHVGLVAAASYAACRWLLARSEWLLLRANVPKLAVALTAPPVLLYAAMAGGSVATMRAVTMVLLVAIATLINRQRNGLASLAAAATGISAWWPGSVLEASFQLSFMAVLSIVLGLRRVTRWWDAWEEARLVRLRDPRWGLLRWAILSQAVTACAFLGTAPLTAWHFNRLSPVALVANAFAVPLLGLIPVSTGLLATLAVPVAPSLASLLFTCAGLVVDGADWLVGLCAALPGGTMRVVSPTLLELLLSYGLLAALLIPRRAARRLLLASCALLLAIDGGHWYAQRFHRGALQVTILSVGQGDSTIIEFPGSAVMVIDGGGLSTTFDVGERVVAPYLWRRKIGRVNTLVLTHSDFDHHGGLAFLVRAFAPGELWWNGWRGRGPRFADLWRTTREEDIPTVVVRRGFRRVIGGVDVLALHPAATTRGTPNNRSLTLRLQYGPTTLLFPGDVEAEGEDALVASSRAALASTILKVPHHGSRSSSSTPFLRSVSPRVAVVSSGQRRRFQMPHPLVLEAYRAAGSEIWRTDLDGAVIIRITAGGQITVKAARNNRSSAFSALNAEGESPFPRELSPSSAPALQPTSDH